VSIGAGPVTGLIDETRYAVDVYPNPTSGRFMVSAAEQTYLHLVNVQGTRQPLIKEGEIYDISALPAGMYLLIQTFANGKQSVSKIIKK
jgi:hypothetical protein